MQKHEHVKSDMHVRMKTENPRSLQVWLHGVESAIANKNESTIQASLVRVPDISNVSITEEHALSEIVTL